MGESPSRSREGLGEGLSHSPSDATCPPPAPPASGRGALAVALSAAAARFGFSATPRLDAELLLAHALGITRSALLLDPARPVPPAFAALVERRAAYEPVAYITGTRGFWSIELQVGPGVLIPRADSETLIEVATGHFTDRTAPLRILDLGTGPGTLLLAALSEFPNARGVGIDASPVALGYARRNAAALGLDDRATLREGDWAEAVDGMFDLILANPPYVATEEPLPDEVSRFEPAEALFAGADGLDDYRRIAPALGRLLAPGGVACIEVGHTQAAAVTALLSAQGLNFDVHQDLGRRDRCITATP